MIMILSNPKSFENVCSGWGNVLKGISLQRVLSIAHMVRETISKDMQLLQIAMTKGLFCVLTQPWMVNAWIWVGIKPFEAYFTHD